MMSDKRFYYLIHNLNEDDEYYEIIDKEERYSFNFIKDEWLAIQVCDCLNEQDRKINVLQNSWEIMNQRLSEKSKCDYKKAIIEFCKFMNINTPLLDVMVDEFLQEVF